MEKLQPVNEYILCKKIEDNTNVNIYVGDIVNKQYDIVEIVEISEDINNQKYIKNMRVIVKKNNILFEEKNIGKYLFIKEADIIGIISNNIDKNNNNM